MSRLTDIKTYMRNNKMIKKIIAGGKEVTKGESEQAMLNRSLSNELVQLIHDYSIRPDAQMINNDQDATGILYAELVDFDADGQKELYVFTKAMRTKEQWSEDDTEIFDNYYIHEIRTVNDE